MADTFKGIITADGKKRQLSYGSVLEAPVSDETLSIRGAFADSKAVGDKFKKVNAETDSIREDSNAIKNKGITPERTSFFADIECLSERFISFTKKILSRYQWKNNC